LDPSDDLPIVPGTVRHLDEGELSKDTIRKLTRRLISALEEERSRIARELHDDLGQRMALLANDLSRFREEIPEGQYHLRTQLGHLERSVEELSSDISRMSHQLHSSKLEFLGLVAALKSLCAELAESHDLDVEFRHQGLNATLPDDVKLCLFRIAQEALTNVVKHSGATKVVVSLATTEQAVRLLISDRGCGFDEGSEGGRGGLGLISMSERLRLVGGQLSIRSRPSSGTQVEAVIPLRGRPEAASSG
jgi:signal transduction histidine kinase